MPALQRAGLRFLARYEASYPISQQAAAAAAELIQNTLEVRGRSVVVVTHRAKSVESVRRKLVEKGYGTPHRQLTDGIGVRVVTKYENDVGPIVTDLQDLLDIDTRKSVDKRTALDLREFGYRSVHLIARLTGSQAKLPKLAALVGRWFEVQVRSVLEHAWAEIEHQVVYKSGIKYRAKGYPSTVFRRFGAVAGALEILDKEFTALRAERARVIDFYRGRYAAGEDERSAFDAARVIAFLEVSRPSGLGWRQAAANGQPFGEGVEVRCVDALRDARLNTAASLRRMFRHRRVASALARFAAAQGISADEVSHLAIIAIVVGIASRSALRRHLPELLGDPALTLALDGVRVWPRSP